MKTTKNNTKKTLKNLMTDGVEFTKLTDGQIQGLFNTATEMLIQMKRAAAEDDNLTEWISEQAESLRSYVFGVVSMYQDQCRVQASNEKIRAKIIASNKK